MGRKKNRKRAFYLIVIFLLAGGGIGGYYFHSQNRQMDRAENKIRSLSRLITAKQTYRDVIYLEEKSFVSGRKVLFSVEFTVEAGIDMSRCRISRNGKGIIQLYVPPVEIFTVDCDETSITQYLNREVLKKHKFSDFAAVIDREKENLRVEALKSDLPARAESNARAIIERFLVNAFPQKDIYIQFARSVGYLTSVPEGESLHG